LPGATILTYESSISDGTKKAQKNIDHVFSKPGLYRVELILEVNQNDNVYFDCTYKGIYCVKEKTIAQTHQENILDDTTVVIKEEQFFAENNDSSQVAYSIEVIRTKEKLNNDNFLFTLMESYG